MAHNIRQALDVAELMANVVGQTKPLIINSNVNRHYYGWVEDPADPSRFDRDIHTINASENEPVETYQIVEIFEAIKEQFEELEGGRCYFWQGIHYDYTTGIWRISWGS